MNIPFSWFSTESPSYPLCITVAPYSSSNTGAPLERTFLSICAFFCAYKRTSENSVPANFAEFHFQKLFDNSKLFLVWAPTSDQKRLKRSHFVVLTATGSRSEGLQRFIKQFQKHNSRKFAVTRSPKGLAKKASALALSVRGPRYATTLALFVARDCCERLQLATLELPEKSWLIEAGLC